MSAPTGGTASIICATVLVVTVDGAAEASSDIVARVNSASVVGIAVHWRVRA